MTKFLKQNWFVVVVAAFFLVISIYFAVETNKNNLPSKSQNGKDIVFSLDGKDFSADEYYDKLAQAAGKQTLFLKFYEAVLDNAIPDTTELLNQVSSNVTSTAYYYQTNYGYGIDYLNQLAMYYYGYPSFEEYVKYSLKGESLYANYIAEHSDEYVTDAFAADSKPRMISYCLIKMENPAEPTDDESKRLAAAKEAWASEEYNVENFADFAKKFSEDTSTSTNGGVLGYVDKNSTLVDAFLDAALKLNAGEVTDWVYDENYGYFLIKCDSTNFEDYKNEAGFVSTIIASNDNLANQIIWEYANKAGYTITDPELEAYVKEQLKLTESEAN